MKENSVIRSMSTGVSYRVTKVENGKVWATGIQTDEDDVPVQVNEKGVPVQEGGKDVPIRGASLFGSVQLTEKFVIVL